MSPDSFDLLMLLRGTTLDHQARVQIGQRLHEMGDSRPGVGLLPDGRPEINWCPVNVPVDPVSFQNEHARVFGGFGLQPYYIARYLVTYRQFKAFLDAPDGFDNDAWWQHLTPRYQKQGVLEQRNPADNCPRDTVSWYQAVAFARWLNALYTGEELLSPGGGPQRLVIGQNAEIRLPFEWEWQWAAQGNFNHAYPWGAWADGVANTREARLGQTTAVGMYPHGASWCGALDMSGNVWEWCLNDYRNPSYGQYEGHNSRVLRGGSFADVAEWAVCGSRFNDLPNRRLDYFGFRVVCAQPMPG